jgi:hypothetical protein
MKLSVAGKDRSEDLGRSIGEAAARLADAGLAETLRREEAVLNLRDRGTEEAFQGMHLDLLRGRNGVDPDAFALVPAAGWRGKIVAAVRRCLWRLLRYQHDWLTFRQNAVNVQLTYALELERRLRQRDRASLENRIRELEEALAKAVREDTP